MANEQRQKPEPVDNSVAMEKIVDIVEKMRYGKIEIVMRGGRIVNVLSTKSFIFVEEKTDENVA